LSDIDAFADALALSFREANDAVEPRRASSPVASELALNAAGS
jgi:hypothetical protein